MAIYLQDTHQSFDLQTSCSKYLTFLYLFLEIIDFFMNEFKEKYKEDSYQEPFLKCLKKF